jgi:dihydroxy-acid dehydratase
MGAGLGKDVALLTRRSLLRAAPTASSSGTSRRRAQEGGPNRPGAHTAIGSSSMRDKKVIDVEISEAEMQSRRDGWKRPPYKADRGTLAKYIRLVKSASEGCVTDDSRASSVLPAPSG